MSSRTWQQRIQDICQAAITIQNRTQSLTFAEFQANETIVKAVLYDYLIIGEATRNIPDEVKERYPQIPWRLMGDMRNIVAHEYFQVQLTVVWEGIQSDIPKLSQQLHSLLQAESDIQDNS